MDWSEVERPIRLESMWMDAFIPDIDAVTMGRWLGTEMVGFGESWERSSDAGRMGVTRGAPQRERMGSVPSAQREREKEEK